MIPAIIPARKPREKAATDTAAPRTEAGTTATATPTGASRTSGGGSGRAALAGPVAERATAIFTVLAEAEAEVHGIAVEDVTFHEVGAWDSIADVVCAAWLIDSLEPTTWSSAPLPLGGGLVRTEHGTLPVPAPATAILLRASRAATTGWRASASRRPGPPSFATSSPPSTSRGSRDESRGPATDSGPAGFPG